MQICASVSRNIAPVRQVERPFVSNKQIPVHAQGASKGEGKEQVLTGRQADICGDPVRNGGQGSRCGLRGLRTRLRATSNQLGAAVDENESLLRHKLEAVLEPKWGTAKPKIAKREN